MQSNIIISMMRNVSHQGTHYAKAIIFEFPHVTRGYHRLLCVPRSDGTCLTQYGSGCHIRTTVREFFKKDLGTEKPDFETAFAHYDPMAHNYHDGQANPQFANIAGLFR